MQSTIVFFLQKLGQQHFGDELMFIPHHHLEAPAQTFSELLGHYEVGSKPVL